MALFQNDIRSASCRPVHVYPPQSASGQSFQQRRGSNEVWRREPFRVGAVDGRQRGERLFGNIGLSSSPTTTAISLQPTSTEITALPRSSDVGRPLALTTTVNRPGTSIKNENRLVSRLASAIRSGVLVGLVQSGWSSGIATCRWYPAPRYLDHSWNAILRSRIACDQVQSHPFSTETRFFPGFEPALIGLPSTSVTPEGASVGCPGRDDLFIADPWVTVMLSA